MNDGSPTGVEDVIVAGQQREQEVAAILKQTLRRVPRFRSHPDRETELYTALTTALKIVEPDWKPSHE